MEYLSLLKQSTQLTEADKILLELLFAENIKEESISDFFKMIDIENISFEKVCLIAQLCVKADYMGVPVEEKNRIRGVIKHILTKNMQLINALMSLAKEYTEHNIEILLCKGAAMRLGYMRKIRYMSDIDIVVHKTDYDQAIFIANEKGWDVLETNNEKHSKHLEYNNGAIIDLHRVSHKTNTFYPEREEHIWKRADNVEIYSNRMKLPCIEDVFALLITNGFSDIIRGKGDKGLLNWINDSVCLLKDNGHFDWDKLYGICKELNVLNIAKIMLTLLKNIIPDKTATNLIQVEDNIFENTEVQKEFNYYWKIRKWNRDDLGKTSSRIKRAYLGRWSDYKYFSYNRGFLSRSIHFIPYLLRDRRIRTRLNIFRSAK